jgi:hypothetical protein
MDGVTPEAIMAALLVEILSQVLEGQLTTRQQRLVDKAMSLFDAETLERQ